MATKLTTADVEKLGKHGKKRALLEHLYTQVAERNAADRDNDKLRASVASLESTIKKIFAAKAEHQDEEFRSLSKRVKELGLENERLRGNITCSQAIMDRVRLVVTENISLKRTVNRLQEYQQSMVSVAKEVAAEEFDQRKPAFRLDFLNRLKWMGTHYAEVKIND